MSGIASKLRSHWLEIAWALFAAANVSVMVRLADWETVPFHFVWVSLTLVYGLRVWRSRTTWAVLALVTVVTGAGLGWGLAHTNHERLDEMAEVPLMAAMFVAMVWHAQREKAASEKVRSLADSEHRLLEREREFVRDASHELRTPITVARGHAELIRETNPGTQAGQDADVVLDELNRLSRISERLLILAASEHPDFLNRWPVPVEGFVLGTARRWIPTAEREWRVEVLDEGTLLADQERLGFALDALIENAVKFTKTGDSIAITSRGEGDWALIEVADNGEGIPGSEQARVFDRFARVDRGRARRTGGTGLGLAIVKAVVEAHVGTVSVDSAVGRGSRFVIRLPGFHRATQGSRAAVPVART
jgi:two-component system OmpR family sensor kinase